MYVTDEKAISIGVVEKSGGTTKDGESYQGYSYLGYVVRGESESRKFYIPDDDPELRSKIYAHASRWGAPILISGDVTSKGKLEIEDVKPMEKAGA